MGCAWTGGGRVAHGLGVGLHMDWGWESCGWTGGGRATHGLGVGYTRLSTEE